MPHFANCRTQQLERDATCSPCALRPALPRPFSQLHCIYALLHSCRAHCNAASSTVNPHSLQVFSLKCWSQMPTPERKYFVSAFPLSVRHLFPFASLHRKLWRVKTASAVLYHLQRQHLLSCYAILLGDRFKAEERRVSFEGNSSLVGGTNIVRHFLIKKGEKEGRRRTRRQDETCCLIH